MFTASRDVRRAGTAALLMAAGLALGGCVNQKSHDELMDVNRSLTERNSILQRSNEELQGENALLQKQRTANEAALAELSRQNSTLKKQLADAGLSLRDLDSRLAGLAFGPLDADTDRALTALAAQYPDIIRYDAARGMLRFASDLTFSSGSDAVQESAKNSLSALARILGGASASQYELMIMGHTDSQPVSAPTIQRGHKTNVHLSAHRAISVRGVLSSLGVPTDKMFVAGWGEFRPAVPNTGNGNTPANRRVEIYLTRAPGGSMGDDPMGEPVSGKASVTHEVAPSRQPDFTK